MIHNVYNSMLIGLFCSSTVFQHGCFTSMPDLQHPAATGGRKDKLYYKDNAFSPVCILLLHLISAFKNK